MDISPFDPNIVYTWAENADKARREAASYFGHDQLSVHHTGLTEPGGYEPDLDNESEMVGTTMKRYAVKGSLR